MNAPSHTVSSEAELLLAANETLERVYYDRADPCVALLVCRNYRLLMGCHAAHEAKLNWMQSAKYWWQQYLKGSTGKVRYVDLDIQPPLMQFKPVDFM